MQPKSSSRLAKDRVCLAVAERFYFHIELNESIYSVACISTDKNRLSCMSLNDLVSSLLFSFRVRQKCCADIGFNQPNVAVVKILQQRSRGHAGNLSRPNDL